MKLNIKGIAFILTVVLSPLALFSQNNQTSAENNEVPKVHVDKLDKKLASFAKTKEEEKEDYQFFSKHYNDFGTFFTALFIQSSLQDNAFEQAIDEFKAKVKVSETERLKKEMTKEEYKEALQGLTRSGNFEPTVEDILDYHTEWIGGYHYNLLFYYHENWQPYRNKIIGNLIPETNNNITFNACSDALDKMFNNIPFFIDKDKETYKKNLAAAQANCGDNVNQQALFLAYKLFLIESLVMDRIIERDYNEIKKGDAFYRIYDEKYTNRINPLK